MKFETQVRVVYRDEKSGKIVRVLKAWGSDPLLRKFTHFGEEPVGADYKKRARERQPLPIDPLKLYSASEVAAILNISYNTALRRMEKMPGCIDISPPAPRRKRGKRMLRVSGLHLKQYLRGKRTSV